MRRPSLRWLPLSPQLDDDTESGARTSIAKRLRWTLLLSSIVPLLIVGVSLIVLNAAAQQRSVYNDQIDLATRVERDISMYADNLHTQLERFALKVRPTTDHDQLTNLAKDLVDRNYPNIIQFSILDETGQERLRMVKLLVVADSELVNRGSESGVQSALREGKSSYTPISRNADGLHSCGRNIGQGGGQDGARRLVERLRVVLDQPGAGVRRQHLAVGLGARHTGLVEDQGTDAGGSLVERENERPGGLLTHRMRF